LHINKLQIRNLRNLAAVDIEPHEHLNVLYGDNGAGKTSVLEAMVVLSRGRSFRTPQASDIIGPESGSFSVFAELGDGSQARTRIGLERSGKHWRARQDGADLNQLSQLSRALPLVLLEPNSHLLLSGAPEERRRYVDWGMFHVEHAVLNTWRAFSKALKQRNAALRAGDLDMLDSLDEVLAQSGERLSDIRGRYVARVAPLVPALVKQISPELSDLSIEYWPGWRHISLVESLRASRARDLDRGSTGSGPHRADLLVSLKGAPARNILSRGEQKLVAACLLLSQAALCREIDRSPLVMLDDLASELDERRFEAVLASAQETAGQVWLTGTARASVEAPHSVFHVEHGRLRQMI
jgi:DNA replication and repair protein RecF